MNRKRREPTFPRAGSVRRNVSNMIISLLAFFMILRILVILKALKKVVVAPRFALWLKVTIVEMIVRTTTAKSN